MKQLVISVGILLVMALAFSCGTASGRPDVLHSASTATLWANSASARPGDPYVVLGSGFPPSATVEVYIGGELWAANSTSEAGTLMVGNEAPSLPVLTVYPIEAFVGTELWATHPYATGQ